MDGPQALPRRIHQALERGWTVLTANQRAARTLHDGFDLDQRALGLTHWEPPAILAWDAWLTSLWHHLLLDGQAFELLLNPTQEQTLWRAIIAEDSAADGAALSLRPIDALAGLAAEAWLLLHTYRGRGRLLTAVSNADTRAFARWAGEFERREACLHFLSEAQLPEALLAAFAASRLIPPTGLLLAGFDSKTPVQTSLLDSIAATGTPIEELDQTSATPSLTLVAATDERAELTACARWLRARLIEQPAAGIAVIAPAIETSRAEIDRVFRQTLAPELNAIDAPASSAHTSSHSAFRWPTRRWSPPRSTFCAGPSFASARPRQRAAALAPLRRGQLGIHSNNQRRPLRIPGPRRVRRLRPAQTASAPTPDLARRTPRAGCSVEIER